MAAVAQEGAVEKYSLSPCVNDLMERPQSALARGVQIRNFDDRQVNPEPITLEDSEILLEEYLSPRKLRALTGVNDLDQVKYLEMKVDTSETSLGNFGALLTNLIQLKVSNSIITSIRDLGSRLDNLRVLWMARCGLQELDGLSSMYNLRELYLAYNELTDLSPLTMVDHVQILDLEGNNIDEISQVEFIAMLSDLTNLTMEGNPICVTPSPDHADPNYDYRQTVHQMLPNLQVLDDEPFNNSSVQKPKTGSVFDADWALINELITEGDLLDSRESIDVGNTPTNSRPGTASRPFTASRAPGGYRPGTGLKPTTAMKRPLTSTRPSTLGSNDQISPVRPISSAGRPLTAARPGSGDSESLTDETSDLTLGTVVCGNPSKALRQRKRNDQSLETPKMFAQFKHKPEHSYDPLEIDDDNLKQIFTELKEWKKHNEGIKTKRAIERAPQVLRIDDEPLQSSSESEHSDDDEDDEVYPDSFTVEKQWKIEADEDSEGQTIQPNISYNQDVRKPGSIRTRLYKRPQAVVNVVLGDKDDQTLHHDDRIHENGIAEIILKTKSVDNIASPASITGDDTRPISGPAAIKREKFRLENDTPETVKLLKPREIVQPVIKMSNQLKDRIAPPNVPRAVTARATMALPTPPRVMKQYHPLSSISSRQPKPPPPK